LRQSLGTVSLRRGLLVDSNFSVSNNPMRSNDDLRQVLATSNGLISTADQKAAALLTIAGVLIAFPAPSILVPASPQAVPFPATFCAAVAAVAFVVSVCAVLAVLFPRTVIRTDTASLISKRWFHEPAGSA
jgi:hypothetical protein